jgi:hypothetical protein
MIAAHPTKQELQRFWENEPIAFHTSPLTGFETQDLSAAQWALLTQTAPAFWEDKTAPKDPSLWAWAIENAREGIATLDIMTRLRVPPAPDSLLRLLLRSGSSTDKISQDTMLFASKHPLAWTTEKDKTSAPELLASPKNIAYLFLLDTEPSLLHWKKPSTGNGLLHSAILYKAKATLGALLGKGASQEPNTAGVTPKQMAMQEMMPWPSTFGKTLSTPAVATPKTRVNKKPLAPENADQMSLF